MSATQVLKVGDRFSSFQEFEERLKRYECEVSNNYIKKYSTSLEKHMEHNPKSNLSHVANQSLKYYNVRYICIKGGNYKPRNKLRKTKTFRQGCEAGLYVRITNCGQYLYVKELNETHNHPSTPALFQAMKKQRLNLPEDVVQLCNEAFKARKSKKIIRNEVIANSGCLVTLKDIRNMNYRMNRHNKDNNDFKSCIESLVNVHKCEVSLEVDEKNNLKCLFFQDEPMKKAIESFPEIIFVDGTYCLNESWFATYIIMVEDANGNGVVVGVGILCQEDEETLDWFIKTFKDKNERSIEIQVILTDKDAPERSVLGRNFPKAVFNISLFHTLQIFNRDISKKNMPSMAQKECDKAKEHFQKLAYASTEDKYRNILAEMRKNVAKPAVEYFDENWSDIKEQWALCFTFSNLSFLNRTNNSLESLIHKLKSVISRYSSLADLIKYIFVTINSFRVNHNKAIAESFHKVSTHKFSDGSPEECFRQLLTDFAFEKVLYQLESMEHCKKIHKMDAEICLVESSEGLLEVRKDNCECLFFKSIRLPCRHILKVRSMFNLPLFDDTICLQRWRKDYLMNCLTLLNPIENPEIECSSNIESMENTQKKRVLTSQEKFKMMQDITTTLCQLSAQVSTETFYERMTILKGLRNKWAGMENDETITEIENVSTVFGMENVTTADETENVSTVFEEEVITDTDMENVSTIYIMENGSTVPEIKDEVVQENLLTLDDIKMPRIKLRPKDTGKTVAGFKRKIPENETKEENQIRLEIAINGKKISENVIKLL